MTRQFFDKGCTVEEEAFSFALVFKLFVQSQSLKTKANKYDKTSSDS